MPDRGILESMIRTAFAILLMTGALAAQTKSTAPQLHVVTYVDVYPNFAPEATRILAEFAANSRKDQGSVRFEVLRDVARANHFAIVEVWQDRATYDSHLGAAHVRGFRDKLQPMLGSPFDERLYNVAQ
jgi:quinol monooxygenase YgiN